MVILRIILALAVFGLPFVLSAWLGSRLRSAVAAFFVAWLATPFLTWLMVVLMWPFIRMASDPNSDGTGVIVLPLVGVLTGIISGIAASVQVGRRKATLPDTAGKE